MLAEVVTVILLLQMQASFIVSFTVCFSHSSDIRFQLRQQFLLGDTAQCTEVITHTDVFQVVQFTEYTHLAEFADSRNKKEAQILSQTFKRTEKLAHFVAELLLKRNI